MNQYAYTLDKLGRRSYKNWDHVWPVGFKVVEKSKLINDITEVGPDVFVVDNFLSLDECNYIISSMEKNSGDHYTGKSLSYFKEIDHDVTHWKHSVDWMMTTSARTKNDIELQNLDNKINANYRNFFLKLEKYYCTFPYCVNPQTDENFKNEKYLTRLFKITDDNGYQIQKTSPGEYYKWHWDANVGTSTQDRVFSTFIYLNDVIKGGETGFPRQAVKIEPRPGRMVCFYSDFTHLHAGLPVVEGFKYLLFCAFSCKLNNGTQTA